MARQQGQEVTHPPMPPRVEFPFSQHSDGTSVRRAIQQLSYKGGNTRTGAGFRYVADNFFGPTQLRPGVPQVCAGRWPWGHPRGLQWVCGPQAGSHSSRLASQICILITDGKSQDDAEGPASKLKSQGIKVFAVGERAFGTRQGGLQLGSGSLPLPIIYISARDQERRPEGTDPCGLHAYRCLLLLCW